LFENQIEELQNNVVNEIQRVAGGDPILIITDIQVFPQDNGILLQIQIEVVPSTDAERLSIFFDITSRRASYI
jgi:hypothetical protein